MEISPIPTARLSEMAGRAQEAWQAPPSPRSPELGAKLRQGRPIRLHPSPPSLDGEEGLRVVEAERPVAPPLLRAEQAVDLPGQRQRRIGPREEQPHGADEALGDGLVIALGVA